jgi:biofilm PGA synthesis protein PgaD
MSVQEYPRTPDIIDRPDLISRSRKHVLAIFAAAGWILWLYLLMPGGALIAWWFGYYRFDTFALSNPEGGTRAIAAYAILIVLLGALFILWAIYNRLRYGGKRIRHRRHAQPDSDERSTAQVLSVGLAEVLAAQASKVQTFEFKEDGSLSQIKETLPGQSIKKAELAS